MPAHDNAARAPVLVVDDDAGVRRAIARALRDVVRVREAGTRDDALALIARQRRWLAALIDANLDGEDGFELVRLLRGREPQLPLAVITGRADAAINHAAYHFGASYLCKPLDEAVLLQFAQQALAAAALRSERAASVIAELARQCGLDAREVAIVIAAARGFGHQEISEDLHIGKEYLRELVARLLRKVRAATLREVETRVLRAALAGTSAVLAPFEGSESAGRRLRGGTRS